MKASFSIEPLTTNHLQESLQLCRTAGWNQLQSDWERLLAHDPSGCFAAMAAGRLCGTVTTTAYGTDLAWIGMMLVVPEMRRQGIATALMQRAIQYLHSCNVRCIKLDATPAGEHVYKQMGFVAQWSFHRWRRDARTQRGDKPGNGRAKPSTQELSPPLLELDRAAFGADRSKLLSMLVGAAADLSAECCMVESGYGILRPGAVAAYLGPIVASNKEAARGLVQHLCECTEQPIFWDIPGPQCAGSELAVQLGFSPVRDLVRMRLGPEIQAADLDLLYALVDPSTG